MVRITPFVLEIKHALVRDFVQHIELVRKKGAIVWREAAEAMRKNEMNGARNNDKFITRGGGFTLVEVMVAPLSWLWGSACALDAGCNPWLTHPF